jgi:hypothetical protein
MTKRMLEEALTALASTGGAALVTAMVTDGWESIKARFARVIGRGRVSEVEVAKARMEQSRAALEGLTGQDLERAQAEQEVVWRTRLSDLLESDPALATDLRALIAEVAVKAGGMATIEQHVVGFDQAQQAVQGQGLQNVTFGGDRGSGVVKG